jgi:hypothetical protein
MMHAPKETWEQTAARLATYGLSAQSIEDYGKALRNYYLNPTIEWLEEGLEASGGPTSAAGYYVLHFCEVPECCRPDGPFKSETDARDWAAQNLVPGLPGG